MKRLILIRHAKSSWSDYSIDDFDRSLNKRGERDAPFMARKLAKKGIKPDLIVSSPAKRAITTAKVFAKAFEYPTKNIRQDKSIYEAAMATVLAIVNGLEDEVNTVIIFGHNPAFTFLANYFITEYIDNLPTCGIVSVVTDMERWRFVNSNNTKLEFLDYPKKYSTKR